MPLCMANISKNSTFQREMLREETRSKSLDDLEKWKCNDMNFFPLSF